MKNNNFYCATGFPVVMMAYTTGKKKENLLFLSFTIRKTKLSLKIFNIYYVKPYQNQHS